MEPVYLKCPPVDNIHTVSGFGGSTPAKIGKSLTVGLSYRKYTDDGLKIYPTVEFKITIDGNWFTVPISVLREWAEKYGQPEHSSSCGQGTAVPSKG